MKTLSLDKMKKPREINLYKWKLHLKSRFGIEEPLPHFVIDRGDNKRRQTHLLKKRLMDMNQVDDALADFYTIGGFEEFRGYALSYNVRA